jgi:hypothetical protein
MNNIPKFFLPGISSEAQEERYKQFAESCKLHVPKIEDRIYSIIYYHDGVEWTATVGEQLRGVKSKVTRRKGKQIENKEYYYDQATVLAIYPGNPYIVFTNSRIDLNIISAWENPFMAGTPKSVKRFLI